MNARVKRAKKGGEIMATKVLEIVVCDLCKSDRPAHGQITVDVCNQHQETITRRRSEGLNEQCSDCGRRFASRQAVSMHRRRAHGISKAAKGRKTPARRKGRVRVR